MYSAFKIGLRRTVGNLLRNDFLLFVVATLLIHWRILIENNMLAYGDLTPFPESADQAWQFFTSSWHNVGLGLSRSPGNLQTFLQWGFIEIFRSPLLAQKLFIILVPIIAYLSFRYFVSNVLFIQSRKVRFLSSFFYAYAPIFLAEFVGGTVYTTLISFAFFPFVFARAIDFIRSPELKDALLLVLFIGFLLSVNAHMIIIFPLSFTVFFVTDIYFFGRKKFITWVLFGLLFCLGIFINPVPFFGDIGIITAENGIQLSSGFVSSFQQFLNDIHFTYGWSVLSRIIRIDGFIDPFQMAVINVWGVTFFYLVVGLIGYTIVRIQSKDMRQRVVVSQILASFLFVGTIIYLIHLNVIDGVFRLFPFLFLFRNPAKLTALSTFFFSGLLAYTLTILTKRLLYKKNGNFVVFLVMLVYLWPLATGDRGLMFTRQQNFTINPEYREIINTIDLKRDWSNETRDWWLPASYEQTEVKLYWLDQNRLESQLGLQQFMENYYSGNLSDLLTTSLQKNELNVSANILKLTQIQHIVISQLQMQASIAAVLKVGGINYSTQTIGRTKVYTVGQYVPKIYLPSRMVICNEAITCLRTVWVDSGTAIEEKAGGKAGRIPTIRYSKMNPDRYSIVVQHSSDPFSLVFSESFDPGWHLYYKPDDNTEIEIATQSHRRVNFYANAWTINPDQTGNRSTYTLVLEFQPRVWLTRSLVFTFVTVLLILIAWLYLWQASLRKAYRRL
jgi:hypothetical protein